MGEEENNRDNPQVSFGEVLRSPDTLTELVEAMHRPMERYLKWKQIVERYERGKHTAFANAFLKTEAETVRERELIAYASPAYVAYLEEWDKAQKEMVKAQVEYDNLRSNFDALTSALAYDRESMKRLGG